LTVTPIEPVGIACTLLYIASSAMRRQSLGGYRFTPPARARLPADQHNEGYGRNAEDEGDVLEGIVCLNSCAPIAQLLVGVATQEVTATDWLRLERILNAATIQDAVLVPIAARLTAHVIAGDALHGKSQSLKTTGVKNQLWA